MPLDEPIRVVPDWVCEILSPTTRRHDLLIKLPYYAKEIVFMRQRKHGSAREMRA